MKEIVSQKNDEIKCLKKQRNKNKFLLFLDNEKIIDEALLSGLQLNQMLIDKAKIHNFEKYLNKSQVILVNESIIKQFSDVVSPQGIIGVFEWKHHNLKPPIGNFLVLDNVQDAGNVGTLIRSALGANFLDIYLVNCASVANSKTLRSSMGACFKVNIYECSLQNFLDFAKQISYPIFYADMNGKNIFSNNFSKPCGIVLGNEGNGVCEQMKNICNSSVSVPMNKNLESLNVAIAGSVIMFQIGKEELL